MKIEFIEFFSLQEVPILLRGEDFEKIKLNHFSILVEMRNLLMVRRRWLTLIRTLYQRGPTTGQSQWVRRCSPVSMRNSVRLRISLELKYWIIIFSGEFCSLLRKFSFWKKMTKIIFFLLTKNDKNIIPHKEKLLDFKL